MSLMQHSICIFSNWQIQFWVNQNIFVGCLWNMTWPKWEIYERLLSFALQSLVNRTLKHIRTLRNVHISLIYTYFYVPKIFCFNLIDPIASIFWLVPRAFCKITSASGPHPVRPKSQGPRTCHGGFVVTFWNGLKQENRILFMEFSLLVCYCWVIGKDTVCSTELLQCLLVIKKQNKFNVV